MRAVTSQLSTDKRVLEQNIDPRPKFTDTSLQIFNKLI